MLFHKTYLHTTSTEWVVFIHGAGSSSSIWFKQLKDFIKHFNVLLVDLRGHGKSKDFLKEGDSLNYTFIDVSRDVVAVLEYLKINKAHFIGISLGTIIIRCIGEVAPGRVKTMIMGGAITRLNTFSKFMVKFADLFRHVVPFIWLYALCAYILMPGRRHRESRELFIKEATKLKQAEFLRWFRLTGEVNSRLRIYYFNEFPVPALYLMGEDDFMFLPNARKTARAHQYAVLEVLPDAGHICNVEQPDLFNNLAIEFIKKHS